MRSNALSFVCTVFITTVCITGCAVPASAFRGDVLDVPAEYATIALALADAATGDTVRVAPNTYYESGLVLSSGVTLMSATWDPETTVIDGGSTRGTILSCYATTGAKVVGLGFANGNGAAGGAVYCDNASVLFDYCIFDSNNSTLGGAMFWTGGTPTIYGCTFSNNTSTGDAGGLYLEFTGGSVMGCNFNLNEALRGGGAFAQFLTTTTAFTECAFDSNVATDDSYGGGGVFVDSQAAPTFTQCRFDDNDAPYGGGAYLGTKVEAEFTNCEFEGNEAIYDGGAVRCSDDDSSFAGCGFLYNTASGFYGGAISTAISSDNVVGTSWFYMNEAPDGGGICVGPNSSMNITDCTIVENVTSSRTGGGAGIYARGINAVATIENTIIAFNTNGEAVYCQDGGTATLTCSCLYDNDGGDWVGCIAGQGTSGGNMTVNPLFCALTFYDLYLCADSPCLPAFNDCGLLIGAFDEGCVACGTPVDRASWGVIKAMYR